MKWIFISLQAGNLHSYCDPSIDVGCVTKRINVKNWLILKKSMLDCNRKWQEKLDLLMHAFFIYIWNMDACRENSRVLDLSYVRIFFGTVTKTKENEYSMRENSRKFYFVMGEWILIHWPSRASIWIVFFFQ